MATFIKNNCACCPATPCEGCCELFPASAFQSYFECGGNNLPTEIYLGGSRQFTTMPFPNNFPGGPTIQMPIWGGVTGGTLLSRDGTGYGDTANGVILELVDPEDSNSGYTWAVYRNSVRSTAAYLVDGSIRHDNFASSYQVNFVPETIYEESTDSSYTTENWWSEDTWIVYRIGCSIWSIPIFDGFWFLYGRERNDWPADYPRQDANFSHRFPYYLSLGYEYGDRFSIYWDPFAAVTADDGTGNFDVGYFIGGVSANRVAVDPNSPTPCYPMNPAGNYRDVNIGIGALYVVS